MAAYGALVSVMYIIDHIQTHPHPPVSIDQKQVESLTQIITFLQDFLEGYSSHVGCTEEEDYWESRIAEAAYDAEDVIESYIVDQILTRSRNDVQNISSIQFYQGVQNVIENMNLVKIEINEKMVVKDQRRIIKSLSTAGAGSSRSTSTTPNVPMIGFDDVLLRMLDKITGGEPVLQVLPIVGMGGIGKTTLARNIYVSPLVQHHFDIRAWSIISHEYNAREILRQVLDQVDGKNGGRDLSESELGLRLHQYLTGRRYLIVMDDIWNIEAWDQVRIFFPDNKNGSRIIVTTRLSNLASQFNYSNCVNMKFLDKYDSWNLFSKTVFGEENCPLELENIGKGIVTGCKGIPLSIVVTGGLLSKFDQTREMWQLIQLILHSNDSLDDNASCLQVLYMSYNYLPVHLKPCFLSIRLFRTDEEIPISLIISNLVAEGFVEPINGKSLEEIALEYIEELVDRNLLIVAKRNHYGKLKSFKMHDLVREVCMREARKLKFLCVLDEEQSIPQGINSHRRIESFLSEYQTPLLQSLESASLVRTFVGNCPRNVSHNLRLLRISVFEKYSEDEKSQDYYEEIFLGLVNLRLLIVDVGEHPLPRIPSTISFLWNLQTIYLYDIRYDYVFEIWKMPQLRHVKTYYGTLDGTYCLPEPLSGEEDTVLENLQTLFVVSNLKFGDWVIKRIPNIKKLKLYYEEEEEYYYYCLHNLFEGTSREEDEYRLNNLCGLHKLETLRLHCSALHSHLVQEVSFPYSLKKLTLVNTKFPWEDMKTKIGVLPQLQVLKLYEKSFGGYEWKTCEDQFLNLKFLLIEYCDIELWITDSTHFPRLEHLKLVCLEKLREIPSCIGDIPTLLSIQLGYCGKSVADSARRIKEEQEELGNEGLQINTCPLGKRVV